MLTARELDWVAKLEILEGYRARDGLAWGHPRLQLVDLQYSDVRADRGLYNRLASRGRMTRLVSEADVVAAMDEPPEDTRAYFRGRCLRQYPDAVAAASWDSVIFDIPAASRCSGCRRWSRCVAPGRTWAGCWTAAPPLPSWWPRSPVNRRLTSGSYRIKSCRCHSRSGVSILATSCLVVIPMQCARVGSGTGRRG